MKTIAIKHNTKGFLLNNGMWSIKHTNPYIRKFENVESAKEIALTLKALDGSFLKKVSIVEILSDTSVFNFERLNTIMIIENE